MQNFDLHVHSTFSDGNNTIEDIVKEAISRGLVKIGISDHSYTSFDESYCISKINIKKYIDEIKALRKKYKDKIEVLCGIEQDFYSLESTSNFDYVIGSVHYIKIDDDYIPVDESADILKRAADKYFSGNIYGLIDLYYKTVADVVDKTNADIIGHFDLITKFNENSSLFNEYDERYTNSFKYAADKLVLSNKVFEINTGAISRGYRSSPYPSKPIFEYLRKKGAKFILSSDSHCVDTLCFKFDDNLYNKKNATD